MGMTRGARVDPETRLVYLEPTSVRLTIAVPLMRRIDELATGAGETVHDYILHCLHEKALDRPKVDRYVAILDWPACRERRILYSSKEGESRLDTGRRARDLLQEEWKKAIGGDITGHRLRMMAMHLVVLPAPEAVRQYPELTITFAS